MPCGQTGKQLDMSFTAGPLTILDSTTQGKCTNTIISELQNLSLTELGTEWYFGRITQISKLGSGKGLVAPRDPQLLPDARQSKGRNGIGYRWFVVASRANNGKLQTEADVVMEWFHAIVDHFHNASISLEGTDSTARRRRVPKVDRAERIPRRCVFSERRCLGART